MKKLLAVSWFLGLFLLICYLAYQGDGFAIVTLGAIGAGVFLFLTTCALEALS